MLGVDCHVIQSKCLRATTAPPYVPEIISVFLHIDYSANLLRMVEGVTTMREKVYTSPSTLFPHIPFFFSTYVHEYILRVFSDRQNASFPPLLRTCPHGLTFNKYKKKKTLQVYRIAKQKNKYNFFSLKLTTNGKY